MRRLLLALIAGSVTVFAFAPFNQWWLAPLSLAFLFFSWRNSSPASCFWSGFAWGFGLFAAGVSWVYLSLQVYGQMPVPLAVFAVTGFVAFLSLFPGMAGYVQARVSGEGRLRQILVVPIVWVIFEWLRGWLLTGFPWLNIGYTQTMFPLSGFAPLGGVYLVSLAVAVVAAGLVLLASDNVARGRGIALVVIVFATSWGLSWYSWVENDGPPLKVAAVQANISLDTKWQQLKRTEAIASYLSLSPREDIDLVVWPETAVSYYVNEVPDDLWSALEERPGDYVFGTIESITSGPEAGLYNSVVVMCGGERQIYRKRHLVPFGEYLPMTPVFGWILEYLHIPMSDFSSWQGPQPALCAGGTRVSVSICYEDAFPGEMRAAVGESKLLINVSEDAWFGDSFAPHQRLQMARMRVLEVGRPMIRASNTGPSVILDHQGIIVASTLQFEVGVAKALVQPTRGITPYTRMGDLPLICIMVLILAIIRWRKPDQG